MKNKKAQKSAVLGLALVMAFFVFVLVLFALIDPFKENLDTARDNTDLNCPGTAGFDQTDFNNDTNFEKLVRRPTCFVTGITMIYFIGAFLIASVVWVARNWRLIS